MNSERRAKKLPRLKPEQSCVMIRSMDWDELSPEGEELTGSRMLLVGGCVILRGL